MNWDQIISTGSLYWLLVVIVILLLVVIGLRKKR